MTTMKMTDENSKRSTEKPKRPYLGFSDISFFSITLLLVVCFTLGYSYIQERDLILEKVSPVIGYVLVACSLGVAFLYIVSFVEEVIRFHFGSEVSETLIKEEVKPVVKVTEDRPQRLREKGLDSGSLVPIPTDHSCGYKTSIYASVVEEKKEVREKGNAPGVKVLLINPKFPVYSQKIPPMGLGYIGAYLTKMGHQVELVNLALRKDYRLIPKIKTFKPDVVCISGLSVQHNEMKSCASLVKTACAQDNRECLVIVGGVHASAMPVELLRECPDIDIVVKGEGELSMEWLLRAGNPVGIPGMFYRNGADIVGIEPIPISNISELPHPWTFLNLSDYDGNKVSGILKPRGRQAVPVLSSRGCPFSCTFCSASQAMGKMIRLRDVDDIISELKELVAKGVKEIQFMDDNFTFYREHAWNVCLAMLKEKLDLVWTLPNGIRADKVDFELLKLMRAAGCYYTGIGIESGSENVLKIMKKNLNLDSVRTLTEDARTLGIITHGFLLVGIPGETEKDLDSTSKFVRSIPLDRISVNQAMPYPGTKLYKDTFEGCGLSWEELHREKMGGTLPHSTKVFTRNLYLRFYLNPFRLAGHVIKFRSVAQWTSLVGGLSTLVSEVRR